MKKAGPQHPEIGFTLLEVLIAFTLVAFVLAAVIQLYSGGLRSTGISEQRVVAVMLAQSKLAELAARQPLEPHAESGLSGNGYRWRAEVRKYWEMAALEEPQANPVVLYQITVDVAWGPAARPRNLELSTLRIGWPQQLTGEGERQ